MASRPLVTLTTDFGSDDHFVGTVKGVILNIVPDAEIVDICHSVQPFDVLDGALTIAQAYSYFPADTVHLVVVDPGVGTKRRAIVARTERHSFVAPDNGVLSLIFAREERLHVHHVTAEHYFLQPVSRTFHARDVFAPVTGYMAKGVAMEKFGDVITDFVRLEIPRPEVVNERTLRGTVLKADRFGNLITNITAEQAALLFQSQPPPFKIMAGNREVPGVKSAYGEAAPGELFAILGSMGYLEIATNQGSALQMLGSGKGLPVEIVLGEATVAAP